MFSYVHLAIGKQPTQCLHTVHRQTNKWPRVVAPTNWRTAHSIVLPQTSVHVMHRGVFSRGMEEDISWPRTESERCC